jgi:hypothetical protein
MVIIKFAWSIAPELKGRSAWKIARTRYLLSNTFRDYLNPSSGVECASSRAGLAQLVADKIHAWLSRNRVERRTGGTGSCFSKAVAVNRFLTMLMTRRKWSTYITFGDTSSDKGRLPAVCRTVSRMASKLICWLEFCCEIWWWKVKFKVRKIRRSEWREWCGKSRVFVVFLWSSWMFCLRIWIVHYPISTDAFQSTDRHQTSTEIAPQNHSNKSSISLQPPLKLPPSNSHFHPNQHT